MNQRNKTLGICFLAIMTAMIFVVNYFRIPFMGTSLHLTNGLCAMAGLLFGPVGGFVCGGLGSLLFDILSGYDVVGCLITLVSKGAIGLMAGLIAYRTAHQQKLDGRSVAVIVLGTVVGVLTYVALYMLKTYIFGIWVNGLTIDATYAKMATKLPGALLNAAFGCIVCPVLYLAVAPALRKAGLMKSVEIIHPFAK